MNADPSQNMSPRITVDLELDPTLTRQLDLNIMSGKISQDVEQILNGLGIPGKPDVQIKPAWETPEHGKPFMTVSIHGQTSALSSTLLHCVYDYVTGESLDDMATPAQIHVSLSKLSPEKTDTLVRMVCAEILRQSAASLLTKELTAIYRAALNGFDQNFLPEVDQLHSLLAAVLELRISIADHAVVAQVLREGVSQKRPPAAIAEELIAALRPKVIEVHMPYAYLKQITVDTPESDRANFAMMRDGLFYELGLRFPIIRFIPVNDLPPDSLRFKINHLETSPIRGLHPGECLVNEIPDRLRLLGIQGRSMINPANQCLCGVIHVEDVALAEEVGLTTWNQMGYAILALSANLRANAACFLDINEVETYLETLGQAFPQLIEAAKEQFSREEITQTLRCLLTEEISIRNLRQILQAMVDLDFGGTKYTMLDAQKSTYYRPGDEWFKNPVNLASLVRMNMKRYISNKYTQPENTLVVYLLDHEIEALLTKDQKAMTDASHKQLELHEKEKILTTLRSEIGDLPSTAKNPVILTTATVRPIFRELIAKEFPHLAVICYHELSADMNIHPIGRISISKN
jgi:type III secretory pathway component EscV